MLIVQLCPTRCDLVDCSPSGSSVHGILQARILEWIAIPFSRGSSQPRNQTLVSCAAVSHQGIVCQVSRNSTYLLCFPCSPVGTGHHEVGTMSCQPENESESHPPAGPTAYRINRNSPRPPLTLGPQGRPCSAPLLLSPVPHKGHRAFAQAVCLPGPETFQRLLLFLT